MDNLSKCVCEAQRRGMSYGQYMASQYDASAEYRAKEAARREKRERERKIAAGMVECEYEYCHNWFKPRDINNKYCCPQCSNAAWKQKHKKEMQKNERNQSQVPAEC